MKMDIRFEEAEESFDATLSESEQNFDADFGQVQTVTEYVGGELYEGAYEVTPRMRAQILPTKAKVMAEDVTVKAIPISKTTNNSGGVTVYIGAMDE